MRCRICNSTIYVNDFSKGLKVYIVEYKCDSCKKYIVYDIYNNDTEEEKYKR